MKTPLQELMHYMEQNQYFIGNDLLAEYKKLLKKEKLETMNILTVLDFNDGKVWQYDISTDKKLQVEDFEQIMLEQGHDLDDCEWMLHAYDTFNRLYYAPTSWLEYAGDTLHIKHIEYYEKH